MLHIEKFVLGPVATNAYLITKLEENKAIIIDPGMNGDQLLQRIENLHIEAILLTHAHFDHIGSVDEIRNKKSCPVYLHGLEWDWMTDAEKNGSLLWPEMIPPIVLNPADEKLTDGQTLSLLGETFQVLHTPGHSPGSVSFYHEEEKIVFGGDVLFRMSVGRTDLQGGSAQQLFDSLHSKLFVLDPNVRVLPGHGEETSIGFEKEHNPYA